jgi:cytidylate kinase
MSNIFLEYMTQRASTGELQHKENGPVITISRQYGSYAAEIAEGVSQKLSVLDSQKWLRVTKEIIEQSASNLNVNPKEIAHIFGGEETQFLGDIIVSFSKKKYAADSHIIKTIRRIVRTYAEQGRCVIVGRAGCIIAGDIPKSLHFKIIAPLNYRTASIARRLNISEGEAAKRVVETEKRREHFLKFFNGDRPDSEIFDAVYNRARMSTDEIIDCIVGLAQKRGLV